MSGTFNFGGDNRGQIVDGDGNTVSQHVEERVEPAADPTDPPPEPPARAQSSRIFVSHAHVDRELAEAVVDLLRLGVDARRSDIFCSSIPGSGIPAGRRWLDVLADELDGTALVVILVTRAYLASTFCMCELGALWIKRVRTVPLVVPPVEIDDLSGILAQTQVLSIGDPSAIDELGKRAAEAIEQPGASVEWSRRRDEFLSAIPGAVSP